MAGAAVAALAGWPACGPAPSKTNDTPAGTTSPSAVPRGGELIVSARTEPRTFNRLTSREATTDFVASLLQGRLVRINRVTDNVEPWLAERWTRDETGLSYTLTLRSNVTFSDGHPFSADDVVFSLEAAYAVPFSADAMQIDGKRLTASAIDPLTVLLRFPVRYAPGLRILDNLWILPRHRLGAALKNRTLPSAWSLSTPPSELVGLGPFVLSSYSPGQRLVFARNPRYWRKDDKGIGLPYLDRLTIEVVPDESTELLRLVSGAIDSTISSEVPAEAYGTVKRAADEGRLRLHDMGVGLDPDAFWINLRPGAFASDRRAAWLQRDELRRAISMAVDRQQFADTVFLGAGVPVYGPITPANKRWYSPDVPRTPHDPAGARMLLASMGLTDRNGDGMLEDANQAPVRFTILTQKGRPSLERGVSVIRDELKKIGIAVDTVALDGGAVIEQIMSGRYDAVYFRPILTDTDPSGNPDFWLSSGSFHFWNLGQKTPGTDWERRIDELMARLTQSLDEVERKHLYDEVQKIFADHLPAVYFVAPRVFAASSIRMTNVTPSVQRPQLLWSPDTVAVAR